MTLLSPHILQFKVGMPVMILHNLKPLIKYNGIKAQITRIDQHIIEAKIIGGSKAGTQIVISCIPLHSKDNKSNVGRKAAIHYQFTQRQYLIHPIFAMIINKSQGQSLCYININIHIRSYFSYGQFYITVFGIMKKKNLYIIISKDEQIVFF